ncbi:hypothetical protein BGX28_003162 [Mortierella sp. GBA30]|nr:hypothetical protein BGX28_003162 [Mortierella sp. GBA30]
MPPIIAESTSSNALATPTVMWSVHVLAPYALVKNVNSETDNINDESYFITRLVNGEDMVTEWNPELRLGIKKAIDTIPHVLRQAWHYIGLESVDQVLDEIVASEQDHDFEGHPKNKDHLDKSSKRNKSSVVRENVLIKAVVLNFTDGMETDGWPGVTVIKGLESRHLAFTGANSTLYYLDSDKARIKKHLVHSHTSTPGYYDVYSYLEDVDNRLRKEKKRPGPNKRHDADDLEKDTPGTHGNRGRADEEGVQEEDEDEEEEEEDIANKAIILEGLSKLNFPLLVKPANSSSSRGITTKSVVDTPEEAYLRAMETKRIWGPVYVEEYISGREFTALVSGSQETGIKVYKVLERVFRSQIPERERMLTHDMKWGVNSYGNDASVKAASWWMQVCCEADQIRLQAEASAIYASFGGNGYCRMDLREDHRSGKVFVVDVNANCSIDEDEDCAMGKILKASGLTLGQFFAILMVDAINVRDNLIAKTRESETIERIVLPTVVSGLKRPSPMSVNSSPDTIDSTPQKAIRIRA